MRWGVMPFRLDFEADPEANVSRTFRCALPVAQDVLLVLSFEGFLDQPHSLCLALKAVMNNSQQYHSLRFLSMLAS